MKAFTHLLSGLVGGALALGGSYWLQNSSNNSLHHSINTVEIEEKKPSSGQLAHNLGDYKAPNDFSVAAEAAMPAVVNITSITRHQARNERERMYMELFGIPQTNKSTGSGVVLSSKGYIVTNNHVIRGATEVEVTLFDNRKYQAEVIGTDPSTDLAVLKIDAPNLPTVEMANSDEAKIGEWVLAVGNPFELNFTVTAGIISAKARNINILGRQSVESFIQTDAAVNPGNSGGALVNTKGQLLGINTAIATPTGSYTGYSFAVPINLVKKVVGDLMEYGEVRRGYLGVMIQDLNSDLAKEKNLTLSEGVYVNDLVKGAAAEQAGLRIGDIILKVNGVATKSVPSLQEQIASRNPGDEVILTVYRKNKIEELKLKLRQ